MSDGRVRGGAEIVQSDDTVHELRVTECLWATTFRQANLADEGHAAICHGGIALVRALIPTLSLIRDKTLMQGHDAAEPDMHGGGHQ